MGPNPDRAQPGLGPNPGPGPSEGETLQEKRTFFRIHFYQKSLFLTSILRFFLYFQRVLHISNRNTLQNDYEITSKGKFWNQNVQFWYGRPDYLSYTLA